MVHSMICTASGYLLCKQKVLDLQHKRDINIPLPLLSRCSLYFFTHMDLR